MRFIEKIKDKNVGDFFAYAIALSLLMGVVSASFAQFHYLKELIVSAFSFLGSFIEFAFHVSLYGAVFAGLIILFTIAYFMFSGDGADFSKNNKR